MQELMAGPRVADAADTGLMATIYGARCAARLVALGLPFAAVVYGLEHQLGVTRDEAMAAALHAMQTSSPVHFQASPAQ